MFHIISGMCAGGLKQHLLCGVPCPELPTVPVCMAWGAQQDDHTGLVCYYCRVSCGNEMLLFLCVGCWTEGPLLGRGSRRRLCAVSVHDARMTKPRREEACVLNPPH